MRILITGGAGYIGTALCHRLAAEKNIEKITVFDNLSRHNYNLLIGARKLDDRFQVVEGDILDSRKLRKEVANADVVFHLAAKVTTPFADQDAHLFEQVNHWGTAEVSYAVEESEVEKLVYLSSVSVYGAGEESKGIDAPLNPRTFYGISKMRGEEHIERLKEQCETYILRCGNVYGYNRSMRFDAVINKFMFEANFHGKVNIHGNGTQHRPFVHIDAAAERLASIVSGEATPGVANLVEDNFSVNEVVEAVRELYPELEVIFINHNLKLRELSVLPQNPVDHAASLERLKTRLADFKTHFTF